MVVHVDEAEIIRAGEHDAVRAGRRLEAPLQRDPVGVAVGIAVGVGQDRFYAAARCLLQEIRAGCRGNGEERRIRRLGQLGEARIAGQPGEPRYLGFTG